MLMTNRNAYLLWQDVVKYAKNRGSIELSGDIEAYLISILMRYLDRPELGKEVLATVFLKALQQQANERYFALQQVGDQCLLVVGLFPKLVEKRTVNTRYFVELGRTAYSSISNKTNDLNALLAAQFIILMDVLRFIRPHTEFMPLEAYEQWNQTGSQHALSILKGYTSAFPFKINK